MGERLRRWWRGFLWLFDQAARIDFAHTILLGLFSFQPVSLVLSVVGSILTSWYLDIPLWQAIPVAVLLALVVNWFAFHRQAKPSPTLVPLREAARRAFEGLEDTKHGGTLSIGLSETSRLAIHIRQFISRADIELYVRTPPSTVSRLLPEKSDLRWVEGSDRLMFGHAALPRFYEDTSVSRGSLDAYIKAMRDKYNTQLAAPLPTDPRGVLVAEALRFIAVGRWPDPLSSREVRESDRDLWGQVISDFQQRARQGDVVVWGKVDLHQPTFDELTQDYWRDHVISMHGFTHFPPEDLFTVTTERPEGSFTHGFLRTDKARIEALWPPR